MTPTRAARVRLAAVLLLAACARLPALPLRQVVEGDGVHYAALARDVLAGDCSGLGNPYWSNLWPGVIALVRLLGAPDVVTAGRLASLLAGVLLAGLAALLAERTLGAASGLLTGLAVAGHPWLIHFSSLVFTESFFACLLAALLLSGWQASTAPGCRPAWGAGTLAGLALVTRPEALAAIVPVVALVLARAGGRRERLVRAAALFTPMVLLLSGHVALCRYYYDTWDFGVGSKGTANLLIGLAGDEAAQERATSEITPEGENRLEAELREQSLLRFALAHPRSLLTHVGHNLRRLASAAVRVFPPLPTALGAEAFPARGGRAILRALGLASLALTVLGLVAALRAPATRTGALYLASVGVLYCAGLAPLNVHDRLIVALAPLPLIFLARGLAALSSRATVSALVLIACGAASVFGVLRAPSLAYGDDPPAQKEAGLWLAARFPAGTRVMTPVPAIAFYFFDAEYEPSRKYDEVDMPWLGYRELLAFARQREATVLAAPEWYLESAGHPAAPSLIEPAGSHPGLIHLATLGGPPPYRVHIYSVQPVENVGSGP